jgi:hypothetical protein
MEHPPLCPQLYTSKKARSLSPKSAKNISVALIQDENLRSVERSFHLFPKFPPELRLRIWKHAIVAIGGRIVCLQPTAKDMVPGVLHASRESRKEAKKTFSIVKSSQPALLFTLFINYAKDTIYLNRWFMDPAKECYPSVAHGAIHFYKGVMKEVKVLAMNLGDLYYLTSSYRGGKRDLWELLHENCPNLNMVKLVIDGPVKGRTNIQFRRLLQSSNCNRSEFFNRHKNLCYVMASLVTAGDKGFCKSVSRALVSIDQTKKLPMKDGEKGNKDGQGVYDPYGIAHVPMRWVSKASLPAAAGSGQ